MYVVWQRVKVAKRCTSDRKRSTGLSAAESANGGTKGISASEPWRVLRAAGDRMVSRYSEHDATLPCSPLPCVQCVQPKIVEQVSQHCW